METAERKSRMAGHAWIGLAVAIAFCINAQAIRAQGFSSIIPLSVVNVTKNTGEKPQSKVWKYDGKWWAVFPNSAGTFIWRLDGNTWTATLKISANTTVKADCKPVGNVCHIFLWKKADSPSQLISAEYSTTTAGYKLWTQRPSTSYVTLDVGTETGTIDIDSRGRMWLASDATSDIRVRWSDPPYTQWSVPIVMGSGVKDDDITVVVALPNESKVGVFWSNQNTQRFSFRTHRDGDDPSVWSADESPCTPYALNVGYGFSDDHMNMKIARDGTLYCASKTSYDTPGYPKLILLKRNAGGTWDSPYEVTQSGTRGIVLLNEAEGKLKYIFTEQEDGGPILYKESQTSTIAFGPTMTLINGTYNNSTSSKDSYDPDVVILTSNATQIVGVLATDVSSVALPATPTLLQPVNASTGLSTQPTLGWSEASGAASYQLQVSTQSNFGSFVLNQTGVTATSWQVNTLQYASSYFWRVRAFNSSGSSAWSAAWTFTTQPQPLMAPILASPADGATDIGFNPNLAWHPSSQASTYEVHVSPVSDFATLATPPTFSSDTTARVSSLYALTKYYWRVRALNTYDTSTWSSVYSFTMKPLAPSAPALLNPADASADVSLAPTLAWASVSNASTYRLQLATDANFQTLTTQADVATTYFAASGLQSLSTYYWRVAALNSGGMSAWSATWSFSTRAAAGNLVALWQFEEGSGTSIFDQSPNANNGETFSTPTWATGHNHLGLKLNGTSQYAVIPNAPSLNVTQSITLAAWVKPEKKASQHIISKGDPDLADGYELSLLSTGKVSFRFNQYTSTAYKINSRAIYPYTGTTWMHVAATFDGAVMRLYINGVEDKAINVTVTAMRISAQPVSIGADLNASSFFKGTLDDLVIYNTALDAAGIAAIFNGSGVLPNTFSGRTTTGASVETDVDSSDVAEVFAVYPNPTTQTFTVQMPANEKGAVNIILYNAANNPIYENTYAADAPIELDMTNFLSGTYILRVQSQQQIRTVKLIKQ